MSHGPFSELSFECHKYVICGLPAPRCGDGVHRLLGTSGSGRQYLWIYYILTHRSSYTPVQEKLLPWVIDFVADARTLPRDVGGVPGEAGGGGSSFRLYSGFMSSWLNSPRTAAGPAARRSHERTRGPLEREGVVLAVLTAGIDHSGSDLVDETLVDCAPEPRSVQPAQIHAGDDSSASRFDELVH